MDQGVRDVVAIRVLPLDLHGRHLPIGLHDPLGVHLSRRVPMLDVLLDLAIHLDVHLYSRDVLHNLLWHCFLQLHDIHRDMYRLCNLNLEMYQQYACHMYPNMYQHCPPLYRMYKLYHR